MSATADHRDELKLWLRNRLTEGERPRQEWRALWEATWEELLATPALDLVDANATNELAERLVDSGLVSEISKPIVAGVAGVVIAELREDEEPIGRFLPVEATKTAFITGAATGIGRALVERLDREGWRCFVGYNRQPPDAVLASTSERALAVRCDVTERASVERALAEVGAALGDEALDLLINNAATTGRAGGGIENVDIEAFKFLFEVNFWGPIRVTQAALPPGPSERCGPDRQRRLGVAIPEHPDGQLLSGHEGGPEAGHAGAPPRDASPRHRGDLPRARRGVDRHARHHRGARGRALSLFPSASALGVPRALQVSGSRRRVDLSGLDAGAVRRPRLPGRPQREATEAELSAGAAGRRTRRHGARAASFPSGEALREDVSTMSRWGDEDE